MAEYLAVPHGEEDTHSPRRTRKSSLSSLFSRSRLADFTTTPVAVAVGAFLATSCFWLFYTIFSELWSHDRVALGEEINGLVPEFPRVPRVFWNDSSYGPEVDVSKLSKTERQSILDNWGKLIPDGEGFLPIEDPTQATLPPPLQKDEPSDPYYYAVSVFHQIHCLDAILRMFLQAHGGGSDTDHASRSKPDAHSSHAEDTAHAMHCFDYIRQSIMCCGDTALEGADPYIIAEGRDTLRYGTFGVGSTHMCKDYGAIYAYARTRANPKWV
ncbi:uncharacterized protein BKCO1_37000176 [Diplodia corticola]|uniref:Tat pathway signal sequence n=1 Tax=Diplodia corticola TaxID=236234 RepID=A0A1J9RXI8_9PEZI|nr:uncharacterized protein BKCO1_37000176 [Diplodia corticola]OJD32548.1 hypothetical protein BKCO1_37000176 [Diplodia corticola]